jgi:hypothetical protein
VLEATGSSRSASGSKICAGSLTSFRGCLSLAYEGDLCPKLNRVFVNDRNTPVLSESVLTGPVILTRCEFLYIITDIL